MNEPAFPCSPDGQNYSKFLGLTIRDWFAGQALAGMIGTVNSQKAADALAPACYIMADAMLRAREAKP